MRLLSCESAANIKEKFLSIAIKQKIRVPFSEGHPGKRKPEQVLMLKKGGFRALQRILSG